MPAQVTEGERFEVVLDGDQRLAAAARPDRGRGRRRRPSALRVLRPRSPFTVRLARLDSASRPPPARRSAHPDRRSARDRSSGGSSLGGPATILVLPRIEPLAGSSGDDGPGGRPPEPRASASSAAGGERESSADPELDGVRPYRPGDEGDADLLARRSPAAPSSPSAISSPPAMRRRCRPRPVRAPVAADGPRPRRPRRRLADGAPRPPRRLRAPDRRLPAAAGRRSRPAGLDERTRGPRRRRRLGGCAATRLRRPALAGDLGRRVARAAASARAHPRLGRRSAGRCRARPSTSPSPGARDIRSAVRSLGEGGRHDAGPARRVRRHRRPRGVAVGDAPRRSADGAAARRRGRRRAPRRRARRAAGNAGPPAGASPPPASSSPRPSPRCSSSASGPDARRPGAGTVSAPGSTSG